MADLDALAQRAVATVNTLAARASTLAAGISGIVGVVAVLVYLLGLAALEGRARSGWMIVGAVLVVVAVGAPLLARWRLGSVRRNSTELVGEVRTLLHQGTDAQRIVIDTFDRSAPDVETGGVRRPAVVVQTRQFDDFRNLAASVSHLRRLPAAMTAVTSFPGLLAIGLILMLVFLVLGFVFLLAWIV